MQKEHHQNNEVIQLQLSTVMTNLNQVVSAVSVLGKSVMDIQRAAILQSAKMGYS